MTLKLMRIMKVKGFRSYVKLKEVLSSVKLLREIKNISRTKSI